MRRWRSPPCWDDVWSRRLLKFALWRAFLSLTSLMVEISARRLRHEPSRVAALLVFRSVWRWTNSLQLVTSLVCTHRYFIEEQIVNNYRHPACEFSGIFSYSALDHGICRFMPLPVKVESSCQNTSQLLGKCWLKLIALVVGFVPLSRHWLLDLEIKQFLSTSGILTR